MKEKMQHQHQYQVRHYLFRAMKTFKQFREQVVAKKTGWIRSLTGKKIFPVPLDLRSVDAKIDSIAGQVSRGAGGV